MKKSLISTLAAIVLLLMVVAIYVRDDNPDDSGDAEVYAMQDQTPANAAPDAAEIDMNVVEVKLREGGGSAGPPVSTGEDEELDDVDMQLRLAGLPTPAEAKRGNEHLKRLGQFSAEDQAAYLNYDDDTLQKLGANGDLLAMEILVDKAMDNYEIDQDRAEKAIEKAIIYGSTRAVMVKAILETSGGSSAIYIDGKDSPEYRDAMRESLAWFQFGMMRGDLTLRHFAQREIKRAGFEMTDEDKMEIDRQARKIFKDMLDRRRELGLGEYDNDVPEGLENYFDLFSAVE